MNFAQAADALADAVREDCPLIDSIGVTVDITELEAWPEFLAIRNQFYCTHFKRLLRRSFFPRRQREIGRRFISAQVNLQQEFINIVVGMAAKEMK